MTKQLNVSVLTELTGMVAAEADGCLIAESVMGQIDF